MYNLLTIFVRAGVLTSNPAIGSMDYCIAKKVESAMENLALEFIYIRAQIFLWITSHFFFAYPLDLFRKWVYFARLFGFY
jgi:hypothetical protein